VIIVDGLSRDETKSIALKWIELNPSHKYIEVPYKFQAPKRNIGVKVSRGRYVFFLDSDQYMLPKLLERAVEYVEKENVDALKIPEVPLYKSSAIARAENIIKYPMGFRVVHYRLFKRDVFNKIGLQDPNIPYVEDLDFFLRMELAGVKLGSMPPMRDAFILHDETISLRSVFLKRYYIGVGTARALYKHGSRSDLFNKYFSSGSQEKARLISKYRLLIDRARRDPQTLLPLMFLIPLRAVAMRIGFYLHRVKPL
jgi:GT2 family glycosyltransferase